MPIKIDFKNFDTSLLLLKKKDILELPQETQQIIKQYKKKEYNNKFRGKKSKDDILYERFTAKFKKNFLDNAVGKQVLNEYLEKQKNI